MLLPIVVVVLVAGFLIGFYAAGVGVGVGGADGGLGSKITGNELYIAPSSNAVAKAVFTETFRGTVKSLNKETLVVSVNGKDMKLPVKKTLFFRQSSESKNTVAPSVKPMQPSELKTGDNLLVSVTFDAKQGNVANVLVVK